MMPKHRLRVIGQSMAIGKGLRDMRLSDIQRQVARGEYRVDNQAVANAIVRRLLAGRGVGPGDDRHAQDECS
jgi:hypothetical protein